MKYYVRQQNEVNYFINVIHTAKNNRNWIGGFTPNYSFMTK